MNSNAADSNEKDVLYDSLSELRKKCPKYERKIIKPARLKNPNKKITKQLTCVLNSLFYTNGKNLDNNENNSEIQDYQDLKKCLFDKLVSKNDYDDKVLVQSDVITIDIDPQSTYLPLMCKLMIICEGAIVERGKCMLVRDVTTQFGNEEISFKINQIQNNVQTQKEFINQGIQTETVEKLKKSEEEIFNGLKIIQDDLNSKFSNSKNNYQNSIRESHHDINELWSIPYYQYQKKKFNKQDFTINTTEEDILNYYRSLETKNENSRQRIPSFRNEMYMLVNNDNRMVKNSNYDQSHFLNRSSLMNETYKIRKSFIEERFSCFEAEVVITDKCETSLDHHIFPISNSSNFYEVQEFNTRSVPKSITFHEKSQLEPSFRITEESEDKRRSHRSSVTNLIMMQVKNGRIV
ncbi:unnamed protein product [Brachionus calyciflorus]|uniref:Uncharacterized protein n=1 Tax=Brachionus calyciflorus TaxID=104777 RepID=A0A813M828_9BILA|nr:unnamed protein product [Brachionus calyciflorus]